MPTSPERFPIGTRVLFTTTHMPGVRPIVGVITNIDTGRSEPYYITFEPTHPEAPGFTFDAGKPYAWRTEDNLTKLDEQWKRDYENLKDRPTS